MDQQCTFRRAEERDLPHITRLAARLLCEKRGRAYHRWKYLQNPAGSFLSVVALFEDEVVGHLGLIPVNFSMKGKKAAFSQEVDVALYEDFRRFDVILKMDSVARDLLRQTGIRISYSIPNEISFLVTETFGIRVKLASVPLLIKPLDVRRSLDRRLPLGPCNRFFGLAANLLMRRVYPRMVDIPAGMCLKRIHYFDRRFDEFWNQIKDDYLIMVERSSEYLNWRYVIAPHKDYEIFCLEDKETVSVYGYLVLGEEREQGLIGQIYDIVTPRGENRGTARCLMRLAVEHFRKMEAVSVRCWMFSHTHLYPELRKLGFWPRPRRNVNIVFQGLQQGPGAMPNEAIKDSRNWFFACGDSDAVVF